MDEKLKAYLARIPAAKKKPPRTYANFQEVAERKTEKLPKKPCKVCDASFWPRHETQEYCCWECRLKDRGEFVRKCAYCGASYRRYERQQEYCSRGCELKARLK